MANVCFSVYSRMCSNKLELGSFIIQQRSVGQRVWKRTRLSERRLAHLLFHRLAHDLDDVSLQMVGII